MEYKSATSGARAILKDSFESPNPKKLSFNIYLESLGNGWFIEVETFDHAYSADPGLAERSTSKRWFFPVKAQAVHWSTGWVEEQIKLRLLP